MDMTTPTQLTTKHTHWWVLRILHRQVDPRPKELFSPMPVVHLMPEQDRETPQTGIYRCPVYKVVTILRERKDPWMRVFSLQLLAGQQ